MFDNLSEASFGINIKNSTKIPLIPLSDLMITTHKHFWLSLAPYAIIKPAADPSMFHQWLEVGRDKEVRVAYGISPPPFSFPCFLFPPLPIPFLPQFLFAPSPSQGSPPLHPARSLRERHEPLSDPSGALTTNGFLVHSELKFTLRTVALYLAYAFRESRILWSALRNGGTVRCF